MSNSETAGSGPRGVGFVVRCDIAGEVQELLLQDNLTVGFVLPGRSLLDSVDRDSRQKMKNFIAAAHSRQPTVGWEMNLQYSGNLRPLLFAAVHVAGGLVVAAATNAILLAGLIDQLKTTGNVPEDRSAPLFEEASRLIRARAEEEGGLFDELTRLNNELAGLQRELVKSNLALDHQREWLWDILASLDDAVVATGTDGTVTFINKAAALLTGREPGVAAAAALGAFLHLAEGPEVGAAQISLNPVLEDGRTIVLEGYLVTEPPRDPLPVSVVVNPLLDRLGTRIGALVLLRDMTSALQTQQLMVETERLGVAAEMAAGMAHTVNNALFIISGNAEALALHVPPEQMRQLENIRAGVRRVAEFTMRLMAFTDVGDENAPAVDLNEVVRTVVAQQHSFSSDVRFHLDLADGLVMVRGDAGKLGRALDIVLSNAREAIHAHGRVDVSTWSETPAGAEARERTILRITDDGEGMTPEVQRRLFIPFATTKFLGRGLGLATARATLAAYGGHIEIQTAPGKGTTVTITLPSASAWHAPGGPAPL